MYNNRDDRLEEEYEAEQRFLMDGDETSDEDEIWVDEEATTKGSFIFNYED